MLHVASRLFSNSLWGPFEKPPLLFCISDEHVNPLWWAHKRERPPCYCAQDALCNGFSQSGLPSSFPLLHPPPPSHIDLNNVDGLTGNCNKACVGADILSIFVFHVDSADTVVLQMGIYRWFPLPVGGWLPHVGLLFKSKCAMIRTFPI